MLCMLKMSKMVFAATLYTEYYYSFTHVEGVKDVKYYVLYSVYRASRPSKGEGYLFEKPSALWVKLFTTSQSEEAALLAFLDLSTTRVIAGKMHSQSQFLKLRGHSATWYVEKASFARDRVCRRHQRCMLHAACSLQNISIIL